MGRLISKSIIGLGILGTFLWGCSNPSTLESSPHWSPPAFELKEIRELTVVKNDPLSNDRWFTTLTSLTRIKPPQWIISSAPEGYSLKDSLANETLINHLLDALKTLLLEGPALQGSLTSFGLEPPRFALQWKDAHQSYELRIGSQSSQFSQSKNSASSYVTQDGKSVWVVSGSALAILETLQSFESLRKTTWTTLDADDVDEIYLKKSQKSRFYAQREGDQWCNHAHRALRQPVNTFLKNLLTAPILRFLDSDAEIQATLSQPPQSPAYEIELLGRKNIKTSMKIYINHGKLFGTNTTRPALVAELDPAFKKQLINFP